MDTKFLHELTEARMIRKLQQIKGANIDDLAQRFFSHLLALAVVYYENPKEGKRYTEKTIEYPHFNIFKPSSPDLYNLIVLVLRQYEYADKVFNNWDIQVPEMRLRRILRAMAAGDPPGTDFHGFMIIIQRKIPNLRSIQIQTRRAVSDYKRMTKSEKEALVRRLLIDMRETGAQSDLWHLLRSVTNNF